MKIRYTFQNRETIEIEVSQEVFEASNSIDREIANRNKAESRSHCSFEYKQSRGFDVPAPNSDPLQQLIERERLDALHCAINNLLPQQRELIRRVFFDHQSLISIAREAGVSEAAIRDRLNKIYKQIKRHLLTVI